jgi:hypothetical protein
VPKKKKLIIVWNTKAACFKPVSWRRIREEVQQLAVKLVVKLVDSGFRVEG